MSEVVLSKALIESRFLHEKYQINLPPWHQLVIWLYTLGSGPINSLLLGNPVGKGLGLWAERFGQVFQEVSKGKKYALPKAFYIYRDFLEGKATLSSNELLAFARLYILNLQQIIKNAPPLTGEIIVHKASSPYPGLEVGDVYQKPFNSTSYRIDMNYSVFLPEGGFCCMHRVTLRRGTRVLILSPLLSAYPDEAEILLPHDVTFQVKFLSSMTLRVPKNPTVVAWKKAQEGPLIVGPVYLYNYKADCDTEPKDIRLYNSVLLEK